MTAKKWEFDGELLTVAEIAERVPALNKSTILHHLKAGRNTRHAMLTFDHLAVQRAAGKRGAKTAGKTMRKLQFGRRGK